MSLLEAIYAGQEYGQELDYYLRQQFVEDQTQPFSDRTSSGSVHALSMTRSSKILAGRVVDTIAYCHWYKVLVEGAKAPVPCCKLSDTSLNPTGVREHDQIQPNSKVWIVMHPQSNYGAILGVEPSFQYDPRAGMSDYISLASRCGLQVDNCHRFPFNLSRKGTIVDWSAGRPVDGTSVGEKGWFAETGVGIFADSMMAYLRADEDTGVHAFYLDQLMRVSGHNLQLRSAAMEMECLDDQNELTVVQGFAPTLPESLGALAPNQTLTRDYTPQESQIAEPHYATLEPAFDDQQPYHRLKHYYGYLAPGGRREVSVPPTAGTVNRYSEQNIFPGMYEETILPTGNMQARSSKGIGFVKKLIGVVPKQIRRPESALGDNETNYKAAGEIGSGPDHIVTGDVGVSGHAGFNRALGILDLQTYEQNYESLLAFSYHSLDYYLPQEEDLEGTLGAPSQRHINFTGLLTDNYLDPPSPISRSVDSRYGDVDYYPNVSYMHLLEDGGVVIGDGWGSEIRMVGGSISISCPGDVLVQPGRRIINLAGTDFVARAANCAEVSATAEDLRLKAGRSLHALGVAGVLIEDKSSLENFTGWAGNVGSDVSSTGVVVKSTANISLLGDSIYARSGVTHAAGGIYLDASAGAARIITNSSSFERYIVHEAVDFFSLTGSLAIANVFAGDGNILGAGLHVAGSATIACSVTAGGNFETTEGFFASGLASADGSLVAQLTGAFLTAALADLLAGKTAEDSAVAAGGQDYLDTFTNSLYAVGHQGNSVVISAVGFSFRTTAQCEATDFRLYETRWQQLSRLWSSSVQTWSELAVVKNSQDTYPFPGEICLSANTLLTQDLNMFDVTNGYAEDRDDPAYQTATLEPFQGAVLNGNYRIITPF